MSKNGKLLRAMTKEQSLVFMATGKVTVGRIWQIEDIKKKTLKGWWVAKVRGVVVGDEDRFKFETEAEARQFGREVLAEWQADMKAAQTTN